jgi:hypothetical protein
MKSPFLRRLARALQNDLGQMRFAAALGAEVERVWDGCPKSITARGSNGETVRVHRKGAVEGMALRRSLLVGAARSFIA